MLSPVQLSSPIEVPLTVQFIFVAPAGTGTAIPIHLPVTAESAPFVWNCGLTLIVTASFL